MRIYQQGPPDGYEWVVPAEPEVTFALQELHGVSKRSTWSPLKVELLTEDDDGSPLRLSDFPFFGSGALVMRESAVAQLGDFVSEYGELLPLDCDDAKLWVLNVIRVIDSLDEEQSSIVRFESGRIMTVRRAVFRGDALSEPQIFKLPQMLRGATYLTQEAVARILEADVEGVEFELIFDG